MPRIAGPSARQVPIVETVRRVSDTAYASAMSTEIVTMPIMYARYSASTQSR